MNARSSSTLPSTLSAIRHLILDLTEIPAEYSARMSLYSSLFTSLPQQQLEDLARIPINQIRTYTTTIFRGQANILALHFRLSMFAIKAFWHEVFLEEFNPISFVRSLHNAYPWNDYTTKAFALNFQKFINTHLYRILARAPELVELCEFELSTLNLKRFKGAKIEQPYFQHTDLLKLSVSQLLDLSFRLAPGVNFLNLQYDVLALWEKRSETYRPANLKASLIIGSRNQANLACWTRVSPSVFELLKNAQDILRAEDLLERLIGDSSLSEEQQAKQAIRELMGLSSTGVVELLET